MGLDTAVPRMSLRLESSASSLFVQFLCKAVNKGYISSEYKMAGERGFNGLIKQFIKEEPDGSYTITNCCAVAGLGGTGNRDGSFAYYIGEPVICLLYTSRCV